MTEPTRTSAALLERPIDDCWNRVGVRGDGSCPELARHVHCHNCPTHRAAALALLDGPPPPAIAAGWTAHFARPVRETKHDIASIFVFRAGVEWLALPTPMVTEVAPLRTIHSLPRRRGGAVLGVANLHGELLTCLSLAHALGLSGGVPAPPVASPSSRGRLLVLRRGDVRAACPVDEVVGIHHVKVSELADLPATVAGPNTCARKVWSWHARSVGLLDADLLARQIVRSLA